MNFRIRSAVALLALAVALSACGGQATPDASVRVPPTRTPRPTFTPTRPVPTATRIMPTNTPLPAPTAVVTPTQAPTTAPTAAPQPAQAQVKVTSDVVNLRSGPGTQFSLVGQGQSGQQFNVTGKNQAGDWWQIDNNGQAAWLSASMVEASGVDNVQVAANIPQPPTAVPAPAQPVVQQPAAPPPPTAKPAPPATKFAAQGFDFRAPSTNPRITVWCRVWNSGKSGFVGGTLRVLQNGAPVGETAFSDGVANGDPGYPSQFKYNNGCKIELPLTPGSYSAVLVEGGNVVSEVNSFTVEGGTREFIAVFQQR